jgi:hypothetical protein
MMHAETLERIAKLEKRLLKVEARLGMLPEGMDAKEICDAKGVIGPGLVAWPEPDIAKARWVFFPESGAVVDLNDEPADDAL